MTDLQVIWKARQADPNRYNLFAKLSLSAKRVLIAPSSDGNFAVLSLEFNTTKSNCFVSYNGGDLEDHPDNVIELPRELFPEAASKFSRVKVKAVPHPPTANEVHVDPLSYRDWQGLEAAAFELEEGLVLEQISVVYPGQILALSLPNDSLARVRVVDTRRHETNCPWPTTDEQDQSRCMCIKQDTEFIIAPRDRPPMPRLRILPASQDYDESMHSLAQELLRSKTVPRIVRVPQFAAAVHPEMLKKVPGWTEHLDDLRVSLEYRDNGEKAVVATLIKSELVPMNAIVLHPLLRLQLGAKVFQSEVSVRSLSIRDMERRIIPACSVGLVPTHVKQISCDAVPSWRTPVHASHESIIHSDATALPSGIVCVGGIVKLGGTDCVTTGTFRLQSNQECFDDGIIEVEDLNETEWMFNEGDETLDVSVNECLLNALPAPIIFSSECLELAGNACENKGLILHGPFGSGKTVTSLLVASAIQLTKSHSIVYLDCQKLRLSRGITLDRIVQELASAVEDAVSKQPCTLVIDSLDEIMPSHSIGASQEDSTRTEQINPVILEQAKLLEDALLHYLRYGRTQGKICVLVTCSACDAIPPALIREVSWADPIAVPQVSTTQREKLFRELLRHKKVAQVDHLKGNVAKFLEDYRLLDIVQLSLRLSREVPQSPSLDQFNAVVSECLNTFVPTSRSEAMVDSRSSKTASWDEIGGLFKAKQQLVDTVIRPSVYRTIYENSKVRLPRGVLLYGPPGCGKTYVIPALAQECGYQLVTSRGPELLDKYIGASEANVRNLFARAAAVAPSILFLDELDALAPRRGSDHTGVTDRIVNQLLTFLDGVEDVTGGKVYIVAASSRPDKVDPALLRPGRLEKHIYFGYPETSDECRDLLVQISRNYNLAEAAKSSLMAHGHTLLSAHKNQNTGSLSPADIKCAFDRARVSAAHKALARGEVEKMEVDFDDIQDSFVSCQPSLPVDEFQRLQSCYAPFRGMATSAVEHSQTLRTALR